MILARSAGGVKEIGLVVRQQVELNGMLPIGGLHRSHRRELCFRLTDKPPRLMPTFS